MIHFSLKYTVCIAAALTVATILGVSNKISGAADERCDAGTTQPRAHGDEAAKAGLKPEVLAKLNVALQQAVENEEVAGVIGLIHRNGERGYFEAFGWQDIEARKPMTKDAIFRLKSMSKPVGTAAALVLFDDGKFALDEPISNHLPEWKEARVEERGELVPARDPITPRMLMTHSSGLYYQMPGKPRFSGMPRRDETTTLEEYSRELASQPLLFHPGEKYQYGTSSDRPLSDIRPPVPPSCSWGEPACSARQQFEPRQTPASGVQPT